MSEAEYKEVLDILDIFTFLKHRYDLLKDSSGIDEW